MLKTVQVSQVFEIEEHKKTLLFIKLFFFLENVSSFQFYCLLLQPVSGDTSRTKDALAFYIALTEKT